MCCLEIVCISMHTTAIFRAKDSHKIFNEGQRNISWTKRPDRIKPVLHLDWGINVQGSLLHEGSLIKGPNNWLGNKLLRSFAFLLISWFSQGWVEIFCWLDLGQTWFTSLLFLRESLWRQWMRSQCHMCTSSSINLFSWNSFCQVNKGLYQILRMVLLLN